MSGKATLYFHQASMPSRAALLGIRSLNIDVEVKHVDLVGKEQRTEKFLKINPVGLVPVFVDTDGFTVYESRAILAYLVNSRKPGSDLYPSDPKKRALVDQRLYFDASVVFPIFQRLVRPLFYDGAKEVNQVVIEESKGVLKLLNGFLDDNEYFAGDKLTIADLSILANVTSFVEFNFDFTDYPKLKDWYKKMQSVPGFDENEAGAKFLAGNVIKTIGKNIL